MGCCAAQVALEVFFVLEGVTVGEGGIDVLAVYQPPLCPANFSPAEDVGKLSFLGVQPCERGVIVYHMMH